MKLPLLLLLSLALPCAAEPRIVYEIQTNRPASGIPREARAQEKTDPHSHGTLAQVLGDTLETVKIQYYSKVWSNRDQVTDYLAGMLHDKRTEAYTFQIWSEGLGEPEIKCLLTFENHQQGQLLIWRTEACLCDENGKWWFVSIYDYFHRKNPEGDRSLSRASQK